jgi:hypothetical protein
MRGPPAGAAGLQPSQQTQDAPSTPEWIRNAAGRHQSDGIRFKSEAWSLASTDGGAGGPPVLAWTEREVTAGTTVLNNHDATVHSLTSCPLRRGGKLFVLLPERSVLRVAAGLPVSGRGCWVVRVPERSWWCEGQALGSFTDAPIRQDLRGKVRGLDPRDEPVLLVGQRTGGIGGSRWANESERLKSRN